MIKDGRPGLLLLTPVNPLLDRRNRERTRMSATVHDVAQCSNVDTKHDTGMCESMTLNADEIFTMTGF